MKVRDSRSEDVGPVIVHFTENGRPVLLEILDASEFITEISKATMRAKEELIEVS